MSEKPLGRMRYILGTDLHSVKQAVLPYKFTFCGVKHFHFVDAHDHPVTLIRWPDQYEPDHGDEFYVTPGYAKKYPGRALQMARLAREFDLVELTLTGETKNTGSASAPSC